MEQAPSSLPVGVRSFLDRQFSKLESMFITKDILPGYTSLPDKPVIGKIYYFKNTIGATITSEGVWVYKSTGWSYLG